MRYLLDTNIWIFYLKNSSSLVGTRLRSTSASDIAVCSVVRAELLHGARKYEKRAERVARVELTLSPFISLPLDIMQQSATILNHEALLLVPMT